MELQVQTSCFTICMVLAKLQDGLLEHADGNGHWVLTICTALSLINGGKLVNLRESSGSICRRLLRRSYHQKSILSAEQTPNMINSSWPMRMSEVCREIILAKKELCKILS
ncbi:uncharacterized protein [Elaeis guineensis]